MRLAQSSSAAMIWKSNNSLVCVFKVLLSMWSVIRENFTWVIMVNKRKQDAKVRKALWSAECDFPHIEQIREQDDSICEDSM